MAMAIVVALLRLLSRFLCIGELKLTETKTHYAPPNSLVEQEPRQKQKQQLKVLMMTSASEKKGRGKSALEKRSLMKGLTKETEWKFIEM